MIFPERGQTVLQLYIRRPSLEAVVPVKELKAFQKLALDPGEIRKVHFLIGYNELYHVSADEESVVDKGKYMIMVGLDSETENQVSLTLL